MIIKPGMRTCAWELNIAGLFWLWHSFQKKRVYSEIWPSFPFFLLLTVFVYRNFKISQYRVVYALFAESKQGFNKVSHCHITKTLKQVSSLIICCLYLQIPVSDLTAAHSLSCFSTPPLNLKLFCVSHLSLRVLPAPMKQILRPSLRSEEWPRSQHRWGMWALADVSTPHPQQLFPAGTTVCCCAVPCRGAVRAGRVVHLH